MGTGRTFNKAPRTRPKKGEAERKRRQTVHCRRLIALGVDEEVVRRMNPKQRREMLQRPARIASK